MSTGVHVYFQISVFIFFEWIPRNGIIFNNQDTEAS